MTDSQTKDLRYKIDMKAQELMNYVDSEIKRAFERSKLENRYAQFKQILENSEPLSEEFITKTAK